MTDTQEPGQTAPLENSLTNAVSQLKNKLANCVLDVAAIGGWSMVFSSIVQAASTEGIEDGRVAGVAQAAADFIAKE